MNARVTGYRHKMQAKHGIDWELKMSSGEKSALKRKENAALLHKRDYGLPADAHLWKAHRKHMEDVNSGDPRRMAEARGRQAVGMSLMALSWWLYENDMIHGAGPRDPEERARWETAGGMPYSLSVPEWVPFLGDGRLQFRKMDPFATVMAIVADAFEILESEDDNLSDETRTDIWTSTMYALFTQLNEKAFLQGISAFLGAITDPERNAHNFAKRFIGSVVPWNSLQRSIRYANDPIIRDTRAILDYVDSRTLHGGGTAPPRYTILGEEARRYKTDPGFWVKAFNVVSPMRWQQNVDDPIYTELENIRYPFAWRPQAHYKGIDLRDVSGPDDYPFEAYHYMQKRTGEITLQQTDGHGVTQDWTLRQTLEDYMIPGGSRYAEYQEDQARKPNPETGRTDAHDNINDFVVDYRDIARWETIENSPELGVLIAQYDYDHAARDYHDMIKQLGKGSDSVKRIEKGMRDAIGQGAVPREWGVGASGP
jgi:hypothetical protein